MIDLTVVIPCFNDGQYLIEAVESVKKYNGSRNLEIIIVNDGSTDQETVKLLATLPSHWIRVIKKENGGPGSARNKGISESTSSIVFTLDADNKIEPAFIDEAIQILENNSHIHMVYGDRMLFGDENYLKVVGPPDLFQQFMYNNLDTCSIFRKSMWMELGGFDESRDIIGYEDWEFWTRALIAGYQFHYLNHLTFWYRRRHDSLVHTNKPSDVHIRKTNYILLKNLETFKSLYATLYYEHLQWKAHQNSTGYKILQWILQLKRRINSLFR